MGLSAGIIGLPNVGKSTLFNALCSASVASENYPFCTIDPNHGIVAVPDDRLSKITAYIQTKKVVPAFLELIDIAGLVKGASKGEGLGNQFLGHIKEVNALIHIVRCFEDKNVVHVDGSVDPLRDIGVVETELILKDLETVQKSLTRLNKAKSVDKQLGEKASVLEILLNDLSCGVPARASTISPDMHSAISDLQLITEKPVLYIANLGENEEGCNKMADEVREYSHSVGAECISVCGKLEAEISEFPEDERQEYLTTLGIKENGLSVLSIAIYKTLGLRTFFTVNDKELHAWTIQKGCVASKAAGTIHSDFEKGFIRAEVYTVGDLEKHKTEAALRGAGKIRSEGRDYVVEDGDIILIRANP